MRFHANLTGCHISTLFSFRTFTNAFRTKNEVAERFAQQKKRKKRLKSAVFRACSAFGTGTRFCLLTGSYILQTGFLYMKNHFLLKNHVMIMFEGVRRCKNV
jgi:hypothetical protein